MPTAESVVRPHTLSSNFSTTSRTDRRAHYRAQLGTPVLVDAFSTWHRARCEDVSVGGVGVECDAALPVGKTVEVYFELPSGVAIETQACVVRASNGRFGLRFTQLERNAEIALRAHCHIASMRCPA
jgi:hypothetical protein